MELNNFIPRKRLLFFVIFTLILIGLIVFSYGALMLSDTVEDITPTIITERGAILDRNGRILAIQTTLYHIAITRSALTNVKTTAAVLSPIVGIGAVQIEERITNSATNFLYLKKKVSQGECDAVPPVASEK